MRKPLMLIVNPNAGSGGYRFGVAEALNMFYGAGWLPTVYFTECVGDGRRIAAEHAAGFERLVCVGGDGTLSDVAAGLMELEVRPAVGYIPMGTTNDMAVTLGISHNPLTAAEQIVKGRARPHDLGAYGDGDYFTYVMGFGAFTEVSYGTKQSLKQSLGHMAYIVEGMKQLPKLTHYEAAVEFDGGELHDDFIFGAVMNSYSMAGLFRFDSDMVELSDGKFELILIRNPKTISELNSILTALMSRKYAGPYVSVRHTSHVRFVFDRPVPWTRDGESGGAFQDMKIVNRRAAIDLIAD